MKKEPDMKTRTKRRICAAISALAFLFAFGTAGGVENNLIPLTQGAIRMWVGLALCAAAAYKGGYMRRK